MASIKRDDVKQKWEETEFPLVCETCLGDNPYIRMTKEPYGKKCQICENPFTVFAWQAGTRGRLKRVEICRNCAQSKNVCQVCIYDLQYGLPVKVRDKILRETGSSDHNALAVPQSQANRSWYTAQQERALAQSSTSATAPNEWAHAKLRDMAQMEPRYERNLPKLCSFFAQGTCDRGMSCPFRHEMPRDRNDPLSNQSTKNRFFGTSDPVANKILGRQRRRDEKEEKEDQEDGYDKARATLYVRLQTPRTSQTPAAAAAPPPLPQLTEMTIRDHFYAFGEIISVRVQADRGQAFVEYSQPEATELAIASMNRKELLGHQLYVAWARAPKRGGETETKSAQDAEGAPRCTVIRPLAAPKVDSSSKTTQSPKLPKGLLTAIKPSAEVAAIAAARRNNGSGGRPGGGPIRRLGASNKDGLISAKTPYYASADPTRLGSNTQRR